MPGDRRSFWRAAGARICVCALLTIVLSATGAPVALAVGGNGEGGAFSELSQSGQEEAVKTQTTEKTSSNEPTSNSKKTVIIALVAAVVLLVAIAFVIVRDARRVAPAGDPQLAEARSAHESAAALRRRHAKAKAARKQRKRSR
jgi:ABC-type Fe3+ transport system permease subunit